MKFDSVLILLYDILGGCRCQNFDNRSDRIRVPMNIKMPREEMQIHHSRVPVSSLSNRGRQITLFRHDPKVPWLVLKPFRLGESPDPNCSWAEIGMRTLLGMLLLLPRTTNLKEKETDPNHSGYKKSNCCHCRWMFFLPLTLISKLKNEIVSTGAQRYPFQSNQGYCQIGGHV